MELDWARSIRDQCQAAGVAFFFKQWSGRHPKRLGRELDGVVWNEFPDEPRRGGSGRRRGTNEPAPILATSSGAVGPIRRRTRIGPVPVATRANAKGHDAKVNPN